MGRRKRVSRKKLVPPAEDSEVEDQFTTHTYTLHNGIVVYSKGNDHVVDAVRCTLLAREQGKLDQAGEETVSLTPLVTEPIFL